MNWLVIIISHQGNFERCVFADVQGWCCVVFVVHTNDSDDRRWRNDDSADGNDDCVVCSSRAGRKPLSRVSGKKACQADPCVHTLLYSITSQTSILPTPTHSPIVCTILPYNYITRPNICLPSRAIHANTAILSGYCLYPCIWSHKSKFYWWTIG